MSQTQAFPRGAQLAGPRDDLKVLEVLTEPMTLPVLERRLAQAGCRNGSMRLRTLLGELHAGRFVQTSGLAAQATYTRTALGARLCPPRATSPPPA